MKFLSLLRNFNLVLFGLVLAGGVGQTSPILAQQPSQAAAEPAASPPARPFISRFNGFYVNLDIGGETNLVSSNFSDSSQTINVSGNDSNGMAIVLDGGFMTTLADRFLIGAGFAYEPLSSDPAAFDGSIAKDSGNRDKYNSSGSFSIYITPAYAVDDLSLVYAKGGFAQATYITSTLRNIQKTESGFVVGGGFKRFLTNRMYGLIEANYFNYSASSATKTTITNSANGNSTSISNTNGQDQFSAYNFLFGVGFRF